MKNYLLFVVFVFVMFLSACHGVNEDEIVPQVRKAEIENKSYQLDKVRNWFEENETLLNEKNSNKNANARETGSETFFAPFVEKLPDWEHMHSFQFPDGRQVYEVSLRNREFVVPRTVLEALGGEDIENKVLQNILFIERTEGGYDVLIARYYPADEEDIRDFDEINYGQLSEGWSGTVDLYGYGEEHANGTTRSMKIARAVYFGMPKETVIGDSFGPDDAAQFAASAVQNASDITYRLFISNPNIMETTVISAFMKNL